MTIEEDRELQALEEFMLNGQQAIRRGTRNRARKTAPATPDALEAALRVGDELDAGLRAPGMNRTEREQLRRDKRPQKTPRNEIREKLIAVKRIAFYIDQQVDWNATTQRRNEVVAGWAALCRHDVDLAKEWFSKGVDPLDLPEATKLAKYGFKPTDLFTVVHRKSLLQHLREGTSIEWCISAFEWHQKTSVGRPASPAPRRASSTYLPARSALRDPSQQLGKPGR